MIKAERMRDMNDPWVTEYRGQFNYAIPANQEVKSFLYDYDNRNYAHPHPSSRLPGDNINDMPPHPTGYVSNGQYYDETGHPYDPPQPPPPPRKRMAKKKDATTATKNGKVNNTSKNNKDIERKAKVTFNNVTIPDPPKFQTSRTANRHIINCADPYAPIVDPHKEHNATFKPFRKPVDDQRARLYHPLNYVGKKLPQPPKARVVAPVPHPPPPPPPSFSPFSTQDSLTYSPFSTQESFNNNKLYSQQNKPQFQVREVEPSPHGPIVPLPSSLSPSISSISSPPLPPPPPPPPLPHIREATPSPRGSFSVSSPSISSLSLTNPPPTPPPPPPKPSVAWEVPSSPQGPVDNRDATYAAVKTIVPPPAFSRDPQDRTTIPAHTCSYHI